MWIKVDVADIASEMTKKNNLDRAVKRTADILLAHLSTLPRAEAKTMRKEVHRVAVKASRSASRGKASKSPQTTGPRLLSRPSAKPA
jgi:hypothetical protein